MHDRLMSEDAARGQVAGSAAEVYESFFVPALFAQWPPVLLAAAGVGSGHRVLDVGCGTGIVAAAAASSVGLEGRVAALDPNAPMLEVARRRPDPVSWHEGVAEAMPFGDDEFDRVLSAFALMFFTDREQALAEMARVLAPDGVVAIATWCSADKSPGYSTLIDLVGRVVGQDGAAALEAPFCLGEAGQVGELLAGSFEDVRVVEHAGVARFESIPAWMHTDVRGWTLSGMVDDETFDRLLAAAHDELARFTDPSGRVEFAAPALIATGRPR
jgi:SAM-dependent methyltransferase